MQIARGNGRTIPNDLLLIGYDGTKIIQNVLPDLTTIVQTIEEITRAAIDVLKKRMDSQKTSLEYQLPVKLKERITG